MLNKELHEVYLSIKLSTFINPEYGALVDMVTGELKKVIDELEWRKL